MSFGSGGCWPSKPGKALEESTGEAGKVTGSKAGNKVSVEKNEKMSRRSLGVLQNPLNLVA
jgi:hypothetical protein